MILIDTSAWVDFFRSRNPAADLVENYLDSNQVAICGPIQLELIRGIRSSSEKEKVLSLLSGCHRLPQPSHLWEEAGEIGRKVRIRGATIKSMDLLIATYALAHSVPLFTLDKDFQAFRSFGLVLIANLPA